MVTSRVKFRVFFGLVALGLLALAIGTAFHILRGIENPKTETMQRMAKEPPKPMDPGRAEFDAAMALIQERKLVPARDKLAYIIRYFPLSERLAEAKRVCGELNIDLLLSAQIDPKKKEYEVPPGAALSKIVANEKTTPEYLRRINKLMDSHIRAGQKLIVRPLEFEVHLQKSAKKLVVMELVEKDRQEFFKEYPILDWKLPAGVVMPFTDSVRQRVATLEGKTLEEMAPSYDAAHKTILMARHQVVLRPAPTSGSGQTIPAGIYLDAHDIDELSMLLRIGTKATFNG